MDHDQNAVIQRAIGEQLKSIIQIEDGVVHVSSENLSINDDSCDGSIHLESPLGVSMQLVEDTLPSGHCVPISDI